MELEPPAVQKPTIQSGFFIGERQRQAKIATMSERKFRFAQSEWS